MAHTFPAKVTVWPPAKGKLWLWGRIERNDEMKYGRAIMIRFGLASSDEPTAFDIRLDKLSTVAPARRREHGVFKNRASHLAA